MRKKLNPGMTEFPGGMIMGCYALVRVSQGESNDNHRMSDLLLRMTGPRLLVGAIDFRAGADIQQIHQCYFVMADVDRVSTFAQDQETALKQGTAEYSGWDFERTWQMDKERGYPFLRCLAGLYPEGHP
jgi:hypothetical protein